MSSTISTSFNRRHFVTSTAAFLGATALALNTTPELCAESLTDLSIICADSFRPLLDGALRNSAAVSLLLDLHSRGSSADQIPDLLLKDSSQYDVLISLMAGPTLAAMRAGKAFNAIPFAATEVVLAFDPKSRFVHAFENAAGDLSASLLLMQQPTLRLARTDPRFDPSGRAAIFTLLLAERKTDQHELARQILGSVINRDQIISEDRLFAALRSGDKDAAFCYKANAIRGRLPFLKLPQQVNLGQDCHFDPSTIHFTVGETTFHAEQLIYYASSLGTGGQPRSARAFVSWLKSSAAQILLSRHQYDVASTAAALNV